MARGIILGLFIFIQVITSLIGMSVIIVNRLHLYDGGLVCSWYWPYYCTSVKLVCYWSPNNPFNDFTGCKYSYAIGVIGMIMPLIGLGTLACANNGRAAALNIGLNGFFNFGWWIAASIYWTVMNNDIQDIPNYPNDNWREFCIGVGWTAFALSVIELGSAVAACKAGGREHDHGDDDAEKPTQALPMAPPTYAPPPPSGQPAYGGPAYPPPPAGAPAYPPPPAGAPAYPPPPAQY